MQCGLQFNATTYVTICLLNIGPTTAELEPNKNTARLNPVVTLTLNVVLQT